MVVRFCAVSELRNEPEITQNGIVIAKNLDVFLWNAKFQGGIYNDAE